MIITRTPFRVSFAGGGSDIADFYREHGGCVLSTSINKYMYMTVHPYFDASRTSLRYSEIEIVNNAKEIKHTIFHQVLNDMNVKGVEVSSTADVPSGTGLGSSSSFTVGLLHALNCYKGIFVSKEKLAREACNVEIIKLNNPIGKQDQYAAAYGGLNFIEFHEDDTVAVTPIVMNSDRKRELQDNLVMFYTGVKHDANKILAEQKRNISEKAKTDNLLKMCELARAMKLSLEKNELDDFGRILHEGWNLKRVLASGVTSEYIDALYSCAMQNGALGGKLLGAGGGGFLLFYCEKDKQKSLENALGLQRFHFKFEQEGTSVIYAGERY